MNVMSRAELRDGLRGGGVPFTTAEAEVLRCGRTPTCSPPDHERARPVVQAAFASDRVTLVSRVGAAVAPRCAPATQGSRRRAGA